LTIDWLALLLALLLKLELLNLSLRILFFVLGVEAGLIIIGNHHLVDLLLTLLADLNLVDRLAH
jgi:hypothetical protein